MADVRVGIVSYNTATLLDRCLAALPAALHGLDAEVVVVDNASRDESVDVARRHPSVDVRSNDTNVGYARAMNVALADTDAPVLIALNPDAVAGPGSLASLVARLRDDPTIGLVVPLLRNEDGSLQHSVHRFPSASVALTMGFVPPPLRRGRIGERFWLEGFADDAFRRGGDIPWAIGAVHAIRTEAVADPAHPYTERWFMYAEDMELCARLHDTGWRVVLEPAAEVVHAGNVAGAAEFGEGRDARWLRATYEWSQDERGAWPTRAMALAWSAGLATKWVAWRLKGGRDQAKRVASELKEHARHLRA